MDINDIDLLLQIVQVTLLYQILTSLTIKQTKLPLTKNYEITKLINCPILSINRLLSFRSIVIIRTIYLTH